MHTPASFKIMFLKWIEKDWSCVRCVSPLTSLPLHPALPAFKLSDEENTFPETWE